MSVVLDAGAVCELLLRRGYDGPIREAIVREAHEVHAPALIDLEVLNALRGLLRGGIIAPLTAERAVRGLRAAAIEREGHDQLADRVWALRDRLTSYDASYLATAERRRGDGGPASLVTTDARFARTVRSIGTVPVVVVPVS